MSWVQWHSGQQNKFAVCVGVFFRYIWTRVIIFLE